MLHGEFVARPLWPAVILLVPSLIFPALYRIAQWSIF